MKTCVLIMLVGAVLGLVKTNEVAGKQLLDDYFNSNDLKPLLSEQAEAMKDEEINAGLKKLMSLYDELNKLKESRVSKRMTYRYGRKRNAMPYRFGKRESDVSYEELLNNLLLSVKDETMPYRYGK